MSDPNSTKALLDAIASVELHLDSPALRMRAADYRARMSEIAVIAQLTHVLRDQPDSIEKHRTLGEALMWSGQTPVALLMEVFDESGMTDALNSHLDPIADGLARKDLPDEDVDFVRQLGPKTPNPKSFWRLLMSEVNFKGNPSSALASFRRTGMDLHRPSCTKLTMFFGMPRPD